MGKAINILQSPKAAETSARPKFMVHTDLPSGKEMNAELQEVRKDLMPQSAFDKIAKDNLIVSDRAVVTPRMVEVTRLVYESMKGGVRGWGTDEPVLFSAMRQLEPREMAELARIYQDHYSRDLIRDLTSELSGADKAEALALLKGERLKADSMGIIRASKKMNDGGDEICSILEYHQARGSLVNFEGYFKNTYSISLSAVLRDKLNGSALHKVLALAEGQAIEWRATKVPTLSTVLNHLSKPDQIAVKNCVDAGEFDSYQDLYYSLKAGQGLRAERLLQDISPSRIEEFKKGYAGVDHLPLETRIKKETSGRMRRDLLDLAQGEAATPEEILLRLQSRFKYEESDFFGLVTNVVSNKNNLVKRDLGRLRKILDQAHRDGEISESEKERVYEATLYCLADIKKTYPAAKDTVKKTTLTTMAAAAGGATGGAGLPVLLTILAGGGAGAVTRSIGDPILSGKTYDSRALPHNIAAGAIIGAVSGGLTLGALSVEVDSHVVAATKATTIIAKQSTATCDPEVIGKTIVDDKD